MTAVVMYLSINIMKRFEKNCFKKAPELGMNHLVHPWGAPISQPLRGREAG